MVLDFETSRFPDGSAYRQEAKAISWADEEGFHYYSDPDFVSALQVSLDKAKLLIGVNVKYDIAWARRLGCILPEKMRVWDCQIAEYVMSGQTVSFASMEQMCELYGIPGKEDAIAGYWAANIETIDIPRALVEEYNIGDIARTLAIYKCQLSDPRMTDQIKQLILLQGADLLVLQEMEQNGIIYDCKGSIAKGNECITEINSLKEKLYEYVDFEHFNFDSGDHLSCWLYGGTVSVSRSVPEQRVYQSGLRKGEQYTINKTIEPAIKTFEGLFKPLPKTALKKEGFYQTGEPILKQLKGGGKEGRLVLQSLLRLAELSKQVGSFLHALPNLMSNMGWQQSTLHPTYNQCVARTGRLSCSKPNAQQFDEVTDGFWISRFL